MLKQVQHDALTVSYQFSNDDLEFFITKPILLSRTYKKFSRINNMLPIEPKYALPLYWAWLWRNLVYMLVLGIVFYPISLFLLTPLFVKVFSFIPESLGLLKNELVESFSFLPLGMFTSYLAFKRVATLRFKEFALSTLLHVSQDSFSKRVRSFWWGWFWRSWLIGLLMEAVLMSIKIDILWDSTTIFLLITLEVLINYLTLVWCLKNNNQGLYLIAPSGFPCHCEEL